MIPHLFILLSIFLHMDDRGAGEWSTIYLLVLAIIAAILMFGVIKPMFSKGAAYVSGGAP